MPEHTITLNSPILMEAGELLDDADVIVEKVVVVDGQQYLVGSYESGRMDSISGTFEPNGEPKQFLVSVDEALDIDGLKNAELNRLLQREIPEIMQGKAASGVDSFRISDGEVFDNLDDAAKSLANASDAVDVSSNVVPDEAVDGARVDTSASIDRDPGSPVNLRGADGLPPGIDDFEIDGQKGSLVVHEIEFADDKPFLTGTFTIDTPTGTDTKEFVLAIDETRFPDPSTLSADDISKLSSPEVVGEMIGAQKHNFVLSVDEAFPNRTALMSDVNKLLPLNGGAFNADIPYLTNLAQEHPGLIDSIMSHGSTRSDNTIKLAILDHIGVDDDFMRQNLVYGTGSLKDFAEHPQIRSTLFENSSNTRTIVAEMASRADELAEQAREVSRMADGAKGLRASSAVAVGAGVLFTAASASANTYSSAQMRDLAAELNQTPIDPNDPESPMILSDEAYNEYVKINIGNNIAITGTEIATDAAGPVGFLISYVTAEREATEALQEWAAEYAPNLSEEMFQALKQGMWQGHTAKTEMFLEAASSLPSDQEGYAEKFHDLIEARNEYFLSRAEATNTRAQFGGVRVTAEQEDHFDRLDELAEMAQNRLISEMDEFMGDPESISEFLDLLPIEDRLEYVRRLAVSEENVEVFAANHREIAEYVAKFNGDDTRFEEGSLERWVATTVRNNIIGHDEIDTSKINAYIIDKMGLSGDDTPDLDEIRAKIDLMASGDVPADAPPELLALIELREAHDMQADYFTELEEDGHIQIVTKYLSDNVNASSPEAAPTPAQENKVEVAATAHALPTNG